MKKDFLQTIKEKLTTEKNELETELKRIATKNDEVTDIDFNSKFPQYGDEEDENAQEVTNYNDRLAIEESLEKTLRDIYSALERIEKGTYGICKYCSNKIDEKRLLARPSSSACMTCKTKISKQ